MRTAAPKAATRSGAAYGRLVLTIIIALTLGACVHTSDPRLAFRAPPPPPIPEDATSHGRISTPEPIVLKQSSALALQSDVALGAADGCSIKDRFDTTAALAYDFSDQKSRLALKMKTDGLSVESGMIRFTYKFQPIKSKKERCRFTSPFQGLAGSAYHELVVRKDNTVWQELKAKTLKFLDR